MPAAPGTVRLMQNLEHGPVTARLTVTYRHLVTFLTGRRPEAGVLDDLPARGVVDEAAGWKVGLIADPALGRFNGIAFGSYTLVDTARCQLGHDHRTPSPRCRCGFHSYDVLAPAVRTWAQRIGTVLLRVELYGDIVRHHHGARAEQQDIVAVHLPGRCESNWCAGRPAGIAQRRGSWFAHCTKHLSTGDLTVAQLRELWQVDISVGVPAN